jgi:hypothetical protein
MEIRHLQHAEIEKERWNETVAASRGSNLYALSWYLDAVSPGWQALVTPDYACVMPLTARTRFGVPYLCQPLLSQQSGILSVQPPDNGQVAAFLEAIPPSFRLIEITLSEHNPVPDTPAFHQHTTYRLDLSHTYEELSGAYSENTRRNLKKAAAESLTYEEGIPIGGFLDLLRQDSSAGSQILLKKNNRKPLLRLIIALLGHNAGGICGVRSTDGTLICAVLLARHQGTHYYLAPGSLEAGRDARAMFYLIDRYIHQHSGTQSTLDFEGSDIPTVARFYAGFGASEHHYPSFRVNRLPGLLKKWADRRIQ